jgi:hypothetical protein
MIFNLFKKLRREYRVYRYGHFKACEMEYLPDAAKEMADFIDKQASEYVFNRLKINDALDAQSG